jgi:hypothetical protein
VNPKKVAIGLCISPEGYFRIKIYRDLAKRRNIVGFTSVYMSIFSRDHDDIGASLPWRGVFVSNYCSSSKNTRWMRRISSELQSG